MGAASFTEDAIHKDAEVSSVGDEKLFPVEPGNLFEIVERWYELEKKHLQEIVIKFEKNDLLYMKRDYLTREQCLSDLGISEGEIIYLDINTKPCIEIQWYPEILIETEKKQQNII